MKKGDAWFPFYVGDYLADTSRLTTEQHGAYLLLMIDYWRKGPPPDNDAVLASIAKLTKTRWKNSRNCVGKFFEIADGQWVHKRIDAERRKASGISDKRHDAGLIGAHKRWAGKVANAIDLPMANACQNDAPSQSQSHKAKATTGATPRFDPLAVALPACIPTQKWAEWIAYRRERKFSTGRTTVDKQLEALTGWASQGMSVAAIIDASIRNSWQGLFEEKSVNGHSAARQNPLRLVAHSAADYEKPL